MLQGPRTAPAAWFDFERCETPVEVLERKVIAASIASEYVFTASEYVFTACEIESFMWRTGLGDKATREACTLAMHSAIPLSLIADSLASPHGLHLRG